MSAKVSGCFRRLRNAAAPGTGAAFEQLPGAEEIQPCAEAGFTDDQTLVGLHGGEAAGQIVLRQEYVLGLGQPAGAGEYTSP